MKFFTAFSAMALLASPHVFAAAGKEGGGGPSILCEYAPTYAMAHNYDLVEGRARHGFDIPMFSESQSQAQLTEAALEKLALLDVGVAIDARERLERINSITKFLPEGILMEYPTDLGSGEASLVQRGCRLVYAAYYEDRGVLRVSKTVFKSFMSDLDRAALMTHEALYLLAREKTGQVDSRSTRLLNSYLYAKDSAPNAEVLEALTTMMTGGFLSPVVVMDSNQELSFTTSCRDPNAVASWGKNSVSWTGSLLFKDSSGNDLPDSDRYMSLPMLEQKGFGSTTVRVQVPKKASSIEMPLHTNSYTGCAGEPLEISYNGKRIMTLTSTHFLLNGIGTNYVIRVY